MTPAEDVIEAQPTCRHTRTSSKRNRPARSGTRLNHRSSGADKAQRSAAAAPPDRFRHKLAKAAAQTSEDAYVGLIVLIAASFAPTRVMFAGVGIDKVAGTDCQGRQTLGIQRPSSRRSRPKCYGPHSFSLLPGCSPGG